VRCRKEEDRASACVGAGKILGVGELVVCEGCLVDPS